MPLPGYGVRPESLGKYASDGRYALQLAYGIAIDVNRTPTSAQITKAIEHYQRRTHAGAP